MSGFELREYTPDEQREDMRKLLKDKGLHGAVEQYCDDINSYASALSYMGHRGIQECLCNILDLIDEYEGMKSEKF